MTLLELVQRAFKRVGLTAPTNAIGSTDENVVRMIELANEEGDDLHQRAIWQALRRETSHVTTAAEDQGSIYTIAGADFSYIDEETVWNRSLDRRWYAVNAIQWQQMKASNVTGPDQYFRIRGNSLLAIPVPAAGDTLAFEWMTRYWCESSGGTGQEMWAEDDDVPRLPGFVMLQGLVWRWKKAQGLEYAEDFATYERYVANAIARDGAKPRVNLSGPYRGLSNVPEGNWNIS